MIWKIKNTYNFKSILIFLFYRQRIKKKKKNYNNTIFEIIDTVICMSFFVKLT